MSCVITTDILFPEIGVGSPSLPLPFLDYGGQPVNSTIMSNDQAPPITRRQRWTRSYAGLGVTWVLTREQYVIFKDFYTTDLGNGAAHFQIPLKYPYNTQTTEWVARFASGFTAEHSDGYFNVQADLDLVNPVMEPSITTLIVGQVDNVSYLGTYHQISSTYWEQQEPADYGIRLVNGRWEVFELIFPGPVVFYIDERDFPNGAWTPDNFPAAYQ